MTPQKKSDDAPFEDLAERALADAVKLREEKLGVGRLSRVPASMNIGPPRRCWRRAFAPSHLSHDADNRKKISARGGGFFRHRWGYYWDGHFPHAVIERESCG